MKTNLCGNRGLEGGVGKKIGIGLGAFVVLLVVVYFVATSGFFFKGVILPKVAKSLNAQITVADASISPFSQVRLTQLNLKTTGDTPLVVAEEVLVRYSLMDILKGNINVSELTLRQPTITIVNEADGTSNLDPLLKKDSTESKPSSKEGETRLNIRNVSLQNGTVRQITKEKDGTVALIELSKLDLGLDQLGNAQSGNLKLGSQIFMQTRRPSGTNDELNASLNGAFAVALTKDLLPQSIKGQTTLDVKSTAGAFKDVAGLNAVLDADMTPTDLRQVALRFTRAGQNLGQLRIAGPFDINTREGRLQIELTSIDKNALNLAGMDFGSTTINSTNQVELGAKGQTVGLMGGLAANKLSIIKGTDRTPELDLNLDYQMNVNLGTKLASIQKLNVNGIQQGQNFLRAGLDREMNLAWGGATAPGSGDAALNILLTNLNLANWKAMVGTNIDAGLVSLAGKIQAQQSGQKLGFDLRAGVAKLAMQAGTNSVQGADVTFAAQGTVTDLNLVDLPKFEFGVRQGGQSAVAAQGSLRYDLKTKASDIKSTADLTLPRLLAIYPVDGVTARQGTLKLATEVKGAGDKLGTTGTATLEGFTGNYQAYAFSNWTAVVDLNTELAGDEVDLRRVAMTFSQAAQKGGNVEVKGKYNLKSSAGNVSFTATDLNEHLFRPILKPSLGENELVSINLTGSGSAALDPKAESAIKADLKLSNWVVRDKAGTLPKSPLEAGFVVDGSMKGELLDLKNCVLRLTPTHRAKNELQLAARIDRSATNQTPSRITLRSDSLDLTTYYNMFAGTPSTNAAPAQPTVAASTTPPKEAEPMQLPFKDLTAELKIDRFFLRDLAISNWVGNIAIKTNTIAIKPFDLILNAGTISVSGLVDVGVPGYRYDLALQTDRVPLEPILATLSTNGQSSLKGIFNSQATITGSGTTESNYLKNLKGNVTFAVTNMDYQVLKPQVRNILVPIAAVLRAPELLQTPINWIAGKTQLGNNRAELQGVEVASEAFYAKVSGPIAFASILTNSTLELPVDLHLRRSIAEKSKLLPPNTPETAKYAPLPSFVTIKGTIGDPKSDINEVNILKLGAIGAINSGLLGKDGDKVLKGLDVVGNLTGKNTNASGTNAPSGPASLLKGIGNIFGKGNETNAPAPSTNAPPKKSSPLDLLNSVLPKKSE